MRVTVITPSLPTRGEMLAECMESVRRQILQPVAHLVATDYERQGSAAMRNALVRATDAGWIAPLDDDDLLYPTHLAFLLGGRGGADGTADADIVYSFCDVEGRHGWSPNREFDADALRQGNYIPTTTLIRRSLLIRLGGWRNSADCPMGFEDWDLWLRALDAGARFACVPDVTWRYRLHPGSKTFVGEPAAA